MAPSIDRPKVGDETRRVLLVGFPELRLAGLEPDLRAVAETISVCFPSKKFDESIEERCPELVIVDVTYLKREVIGPLFRLRFSDSDAVIVYVADCAPAEGDDLRRLEGGVLVDGTVSGLAWLAAGGPLRLVASTVHKWERVPNPLTTGWPPAADPRRPGLCPKEELE
jgi:hypothetical protein